MPAVHLSGSQTLTFVHIPRAAGTSVGSWLTNHADKKGDIHIWFDHPTISEICQVCNVQFSFAIVRNPWARALSSYLLFSNVEQLFNQAKGVVDARHTFLKYPDQKTVDLYKFLLESNSGYFKKPVSFEQFIDDARSLTLPKGILTTELPVPISQKYWIDSGVDLIMKQETLETDFKIIQEMFNTNDPLPNLSTTEHSDYRQYYNDKYRKLVEKEYEEEIDLFKYTF